MFAFVGGNLALDLVGTLAERGSSETELLPDARALGRWLVEAGVLDRAPDVTEDELEAARQLRESLYRLLSALTQGRALPRADLSRINAAAAGQPPRVRVSPTGRVTRDGDVGNGLVAIARSFAELCAEPGRVRWCEGPRCTRPFMDRSRAGRRRWCGMAGCGDRAKAAAYRARRRAGRTRGRP